MSTMPPRVSSGRHRVLGRATKTLALVGLGFVALLALAGVILASCMNSFNFGGAGRKHLKPIPIAASACPYVRRLHNIANAVQRDEPVPVLDVDLPDLTKAPLAWPSPSRLRARRFS